MQRTKRVQGWPGLPSHWANVSESIPAAMLIAKGDWDCHRMANVEELPPVPFLDLLGKIGLPTRVRDEKGDRAFDPAEFDESRKAQPKVRQA